jgi:hypothetical protein
MKSSLFLDVTQRRLAVADISGLYRNVGNYQSTPRNIPEERRSYTAAEAWHHKLLRSANVITRRGQSTISPKWERSDVSRSVKYNAVTFHSDPSARLAIVRSPKSSSGCTQCLRKCGCEIWCVTILPEFTYVQSSCLDSCGVS